MKKILFLLSFALLLCYPSASLFYAATGLQLWFECMVPVLFPFMILSGIVIRQNLTDSITGALSPFLSPLFHITPGGIYCLIIGFLCGFPMGARTVAQMYERGSLSRREAAHLLSFCNNIGPVYFLSFLLPTIGCKDRRLPFFLFGMYGIPLLYGIFVGATGFGLPDSQKQGVGAKNSSVGKPVENISLSLEYAMDSAIHGITVLGGYMILFNLCNLLPYACARLFHLELSESFLGVCNCLFEITSGVRRVKDALPAAVLICLPMGGLSCLAQTKSMLKGTDLSLKNYVFHKGIQTLLAALYYLFLFRFLFLRLFPA